ncbi:MAG: hypothetical protein MUE30_14290 [Spirosomaceae bacterium]|nr:hypothetical protein [Spirosomataceae bacterium]
MVEIIFGKDAEISKDIAKVGAKSKAIFGKYQKHGDSFCKSKRHLKHYQKISS